MVLILDVMVDKKCGIKGRKALPSRELIPLVVDLLLSSRSGIRRNEVTRKPSL
jgi:hypothetical protein